MSKKTAGKRNAPTYIDVDYLGEAGPDGEISIGLNVRRYVEVDTEIGQLELNAWEARKMAKMLLAAADRLEQISH